MKANCLNPRRYLVAASVMLIGVVLRCYNAGAKARRGSEENRSSGPDILRTENDDDPEYREQRREFLNRFFGNSSSGVSASAFAASNAGVFASTDGGITWGNMSESIPSGMLVSALSFNAASRQLAASTYGRGVYILSVDRSVQPHPRPRPTPLPRP